MFVWCSGEVLLKMIIVEFVWDVNFDSNVNVVEMVIKCLCVKFDGLFVDKLLYMICGMGYVFEVCEDGDVEWCV